MKRCCTCKVEKSFEEFSKNKSNKDGYHSGCKSCLKKYKKENKDKISEYNKKYYEENKDRLCERSKQYGKQYYEENKDRISEKNKEYYEENKDRISEKNKEYKKENKDKINALWSKRRAKKLQATPIWLTKEHLKSIERFYSISKEMELISGVKYHVDHIIPLQGETVCGLHVPWNLQVIEATENIVKGNKLLDQDQEFYHQRQEFDDLMENICEKY